ncbi:putative baseplate assembly protein [Kitasatospora sp. NPDC050543]|uniref:putative baseplate assembly protein n=1 Tax=Kitasatospora sp. NPDC050543 TaxID=3364054 RepID=UPI00379C4C02
MNDCTCGCRAGTGTPARHAASPANPPGLPALRLRVGTHPTFLTAMLDRLAAADLPGTAGLTTRRTDDPAIVLCDAWAAVADVLTFYQERIGNEGYLRTATEARSVHELTRLVGYRPRPGVAAGTHLSFTLESGHTEVVPAGTKVQSLPGPGELSQAYETSAPLPALAAANRLPVRTTRPQVITTGNAATLPELWFEGIATRLRTNDLLLIRTAGSCGGFHCESRRVSTVEEDAEHLRTRVVLAGGEQQPPPPWHQIQDLDQLVELLTGPPEDEAPRVPTARTSDARLRLAELLHPELAGALHTAWAGATVTGPPTAEVYALRLAAPLFGYNAARKPTYQRNRLLPMEQWLDWDMTQNSDGESESAPLPETADVIHLDNPYQDIRGGTLAVVALRDTGQSDDRRAEPGAESFTVLGNDPEAPFAVDLVARSAYGLAARTTRITLGPGDDWPAPTTMDELRRITVHAAAELLPLAELPITEPVQGRVIELGTLIDGLESGRLLVVSGERADLPGVTGVTAAEPARIAEVYQGRAAPRIESLSAADAQGPTAADARSVGESDARRLASADVPGERNHSFLLLEHPLTHRYRRDTVTVHGNVVHATHGETRTEVLGSGDASVPNQRFALRSGPLTYVSAPTPTGVESTLQVTVDAVRWPERPWFLGLGPDDRGYVTESDEHTGTGVVFPDGTQGRRPPTGSENIRARYRTGIGRSGNTGAGRITLLATKPLGVRDVVNPLPATGGADPERPDQARAGAPLPLKTLDRLVSLSDYADFARAFAGVGKAAADRLADGRGGLIAVTVTGVDGALLLPDSDVIGNLRTALRRFGDPAVRIRVLPAERLLVSVDARVRLLPDRQWASVAPALAAALLDTFGPVRRELAQDLPLSEVVAVLQSVPGVHSCRDLRLASVPPGESAPPDAHPGPWLPACGARRIDDVLYPAQHLCTAVELPELLGLKEDAV